jgi:class 3 adenylate cyclase
MSRARGDRAARPRRAGACIGGILFADVNGFSRLRSDAQVVEFFREFLGCVSEVIERAPEPPLVRNTWGDGLYMVFGGLRAAGLFALELSRSAAAIDWASRGLPADLRPRIALHAGPVFSYTDPVTGQPAWTGRHVTHAARMEPVTPPGLVYASREFAALAAAQRIREFYCEPVGRVRLAKSEGVEPLFVVRAQGHPPPG